VYGKAIPLSLISFTLLLAAAGGAGSAQGSGPSSVQFFKWLLGFGIGGEGVLGGGTVAEGSLWIVPFDGGTPERLTAFADYARPVFTTDGNSILARRGQTLVRVDVTSLEVKSIAEVPGLIAPLSVADDGDVLAMVAGSPVPKPVAVSSKGVQPIEVPEPKVWTEIARAALRERKTYGELAIEVDTNPESFRRPRKTVDLFAVEGEARRQLTFCYPASCVHPAFDSKSRRVTFIMGGPP
jgi:hypothetical protein